MMYLYIRICIAA